jgi:hypothetical protein
MPAVRIDHQRQLAGAVDAVRLLREFTQGQNDQVGSPEHRQRGDGAREHAELEAEILGDARGDRVVNRSGMNAAIAVQDFAEARAAVGPMHDEFPQCSSHFDEQSEQSSADAVEGVAFLALVVRGRDGPTGNKNRRHSGNTPCSKCLIDKHV